jgi:hypothetical protein
MNASPASPTRSPRNARLQALNANHRPPSSRRADRQIAALRQRVHASAPAHSTGEFEEKQVMSTNRINRVPKILEQCLFLATSLSAPQA